MYIGDLGELDRVPAMDFLAGALRRCGLLVTLVDASQHRYIDIYCTSGQTTELEHSESEEESDY